MIQQSSMSEKKTDKYNINHFNGVGKMSMESFLTSSDRFGTALTDSKSVEN